ncbi:MAG: peptide deformylase, partial [Nitriliruptor sp.]|uniref:peptide deformylase n=1 Tax=Nitriliruptor sp. TaxID=2448056 RepID=UPI0034A09614
GVGPGGVGPGGIIGGAVVNPVLLDSSEELQEGDEGCLSFPGLFYPVDRPLRVEVAHQDLHGDDHTVQLEGFLARIFLHEMDHLNGILFIDHLAEHDRKAAMKVMREQRLAEQGQAPSAPVAGGLLLGSSGVRGRGDGAVRLDRPRGS